MGIIRSCRPRPVSRWLIPVFIATAVATWPAIAPADDDLTAGRRAAAKAPGGDGWRPKTDAAGDVRGAASQAEGAPDVAPVPAKTASPVGKGDGVSPNTFAGTNPDRPADTLPKQRPSMATSAGGGASSLAAERSAVEKVTSKTTIDEILTMTLPGRSDRPVDWRAGPEALHRCGDPRWIEPCIPPPPCHPSLPPHPLDLVGVPGDPTSGPIYRGPCCPRTGTHDDGRLPGVHRLQDRLFDAFYRTK